MDEHRRYEQEFGAEARKLRKYYRWSQEELAERLTDEGFPMHQTTIAKLERGARPIRLAEAHALMEILRGPPPPPLLDQPPCAPPLPRFEE